MIITLVGNKVDLEDSRQVEKGVSKNTIYCNYVRKYHNKILQDANQYAKEQQLTFFETSAKSGENIDELFTALGKFCNNQQHKIEYNID